jgi:hypothetical protein
VGFQVIKVIFMPRESEQIETVVQIERDVRSIIYGTVVDEQRRPIKNAVVKLFELPDPESCCRLVPLAHAFTDEYGQYIFGPLAADKHYLIKSWYSAAMAKVMEEDRGC